MCSFLDAILEQEVGDDNYTLTAELLEDLTCLFPEKTEASTKAQLKGPSNLSTLGRRQNQRIG